MNESELLEKVRQLPEEEQDALLQHVQDLLMQSKKNANLLLSFAGIWNDDEASQIEKAIELGCENIENAD